MRQGALSATKERQATLWSTRNYMVYPACGKGVHTSTPLGILPVVKRLPVMGLF